MRLSDYIDKSFIFTNVDGESGYDVISSCIQRIKQKDGWNVELEKEVENIIKNEENFHHINNGIWNLKIETNNYNDVLISLINPKNLNIQNQKIKIIFFTIFNSYENNLINKFSKSIENLSENKNILSIENFKDSDQLFSVVKNSNIKVFKKQSISNLLTNIEPLLVDDTLDKVFKKFAFTNMEELPVVNNLGNLIGSINSFNIIKKFMPDSNIFWIEGLSYLSCEYFLFKSILKSQKLKVENFLKKNIITLTESANLTDLIFFIIVKRKNNIYIVDKNKNYLGMVTINNIMRILFNKEWN